MRDSLSLLEIWGLIFPLGMTFLLLETWCVAYISPEKAVLVGVDWYGEAKYEVVILPIAILFAVLGQWSIFRKCVSKGGV